MRREWRKGDDELVPVQTRICRACLDGVGEMCNTPGCFLIRHEVLTGWHPEEYAIAQPEAPDINIQKALKMARAYGENAKAAETELIRADAENKKLRAENESWQLRFNCPRHGHKHWDAECRCDLSRVSLPDSEPAEPESGGGR